MNFSSVIGVLLGGGIMVASIHESGMPIAFFLNFHGIVIVIGGTLAAASLSYPLSKLIALSRVFLLRVIGGGRTNYEPIIEEILSLGKKISSGTVSLKDEIARISHPFLRESVSLVAEGILTEKELRHVLEQRIKTIEARYQYEANMFKNIGRFPPAFGLLATTLGMIALLSKLGQPSAEKLIGPAMSIGLVGTLYGIALANFVFLPIGENLTEKTKEEVVLRKMILEGALLLKQQVNPVTLRENLNSFLPPNQRINKRAA
jgi:chemotaxis protein MotA